MVAEVTNDKWYFFFVINNIKSEAQNEMNNQSCQTMKIMSNSREILGKTNFCLFGDDLLLPAQP